MSHYSVAVLTNEDTGDVEDQLAPFNEEGEEYFKFDIEIKKGEEEKNREEELSGDYWSKPEKKSERDRYMAMTPKEFIEEYHGYQEDDDGNWGTMNNPNGQWDWFEVGGRWKAMLKIKPEAKGDYSPLEKVGLTGYSDSYIKEYNEKVAEGLWLNSAKVKDIDWDGMRADSEMRLRDTYKKYASELESPTGVLARCNADVLIAENQVKRARRTGDATAMATADADLMQAKAALNSVLEYQFGDVRIGESEDEYVTRNLEPFSTYSIITLDGEWHDCNKTWDKKASAYTKVELNSYYDTYLKDLDPETTITIVDIHN